MNHFFYILKHSHMQAFSYSIVFFVATFLGSLFGMHLAEKIPQKYLKDDSKQSINLGIGLVATMTALILGLVMASTKTSFDAMDAAMKQSAIQILVLDRTLEQYGPEADDIRAGWKASVGRAIQSDKMRRGSEEEIVEGRFFSEVDRLAKQVRQLRPRDDDQRKLYASALEVSEGLLKSRWRVVTSIGPSFSMLFMGMLLFWLTLTFIGFGLISPRNRLVITMFFFSALSTASAIFLILELDGAFDGFIFIGSDPLAFAHKLLNR